MITVKKKLRKLYQWLPGSQWKQNLKWRYLSRRYKALLTELARVPIVHSGLELVGDSQIPFVVFNDNIVLYGREANQFWPEIDLEMMEQVVEAIKEGLES